MDKTHYQVVVDGEPIIWNVDGECRWFDRERVCDVVSDLQTYVNPRNIRVWKVWVHNTYGLYTKPEVEDITCEIAAVIANAKLASDGEGIEPDTLSWPESFFGGFAAFHADEWCETITREALDERMEAAQ